MIDTMDVDHGPLSFTDQVPSAIEKAKETDPGSFKSIPMLAHDAVSLIKILVKTHCGLDIGPIDILKYSYEHRAFDTFLHKAYEGKSYEQFLYDGMIPGH